MIEIKELTKIYPNGYEANSSISFVVPNGKIVGIVGPNGAGKSTLLRQILGVSIKTSGDIIIDDTNNKIKDISYCPQMPIFYPALSVKESLVVVMKYKGFSKFDYENKINNVLEELQISDLKNSYTYMLSGGERKILSIASSLIQDSGNLILDEPTSMLDINAKNIIWEILLREKSKGKAILISSHDITEIKNICDEIVVLKDGKVIFNGSPKELGKSFYKITFISSNRDILNKLEKFGYNETINDNMISIVCDNKEKALELFNVLSNKKDVDSLSIECPSIYEGILSIIKKEENSD